MLAAYKFWLIKRGLSQRELALQIRVPEAVLSHAFRGRRKLPVETAKAVARGLEIDLASITKAEVAK